jgi:hypothetical protein
MKNANSTKQSETWIKRTCLTIQLQQKYQYTRKYTIATHKLIGRASSRANKKYKCMKPNNFLNRLNKITDLKSKSKGAQNKFTL